MGVLFRGNTEFHCLVNALVFYINWYSLKIALSIEMHYWQTLDKMLCFRILRYQ